MNYSEKVMSEIASFSVKNKCSIFDACVDFCEKNDMYSDDFFESLDPTSKEIIKESALQENMIRKKHIEKSNHITYGDVI